MDYSRIMFADTKFTKNNIRFAFARNIHSLKELENTCILNQTEKDYYNTLRSQQRKLEFLTTRVLLQNEFNKSYEIDYKESGQPFIKNKPQLNISISHNKQWVVIAISKQKIGIDIEEISEKVYRIKEKFCSNEELQNVDLKQKLKHLTILWSAKESLYKLLQDKSIIFKEDLIIKKFIPQEKDLCESFFRKTQKIIPVYYQVIENTIFTYCLQ